MDKTGKTRTVYNFLNTCNKCFNDIEYPLLGDFSYGELIFQTTDGQDFFLVELINNKTFDFICTFLKNKAGQKIRKADPQKILALLADKGKGKEFAIDYPICPICINYCLQSKTSVYQIDEYKGRGSQGKLALFRIKKIKMPKIGKTQQQEIVDEIKAELDKQELLKQQITTERNKIDKIIEECIMTAQ